MEVLRTFCAGISGFFQKYCISCDSLGAVTGFKFAKFTWVVTLKPNSVDIALRALYLGQVSVMICLPLPTSIVILPPFLCESDLSVTLMESNSCCRGGLLYLFDGVCVCVRMPVLSLRPAAQWAIACPTTLLLVMAAGTLLLPHAFP